MAPHQRKLTSKESNRLQREIKVISQFLNISPLTDDEEIDIQKYDSLNKQELMIHLFLDFFLPKNLFPELIEEDLAYLLAYNLLGVVEKDKLTEEWYEKRELSPARPDQTFLNFEDGTFYRSVNDLLEADSHTYGEFLPLVIKRIQRLRKFIRAPLSYREATRYLDNIWMSWKPKLTKNDIKIVLHIDAHPFATKKEIAKALNLHKNSVKYIFERLEKLFHLVVYGLPNLKRMGLNKLLVKLPTRVSIEFPYRASVQEVRAGNTVSVYSFDLPCQRGAVYPLQEFYNRLEDQLDDFSMYQVIENKHNISFQYFDVNENNWDIDWDAWALWLERILYEERYHMVSPDLVKLSEREEKRISFDLKDLQIIDYYKNNLRMSMATLGRLIGMTRAGTRQRIKRLMDESVLIPIILMSQMGLDEQILVIYSGDEEYLQPFEAALFELPVVFSYALKGFPSSSKKVLQAWIQLPPGSYIKLTDAIKNTLRESDAIWTAHRYQFRSGAKALPIEMFDENIKDWRWDENVLAQLKIKK